MKSFVIAVASAAALSALAQSPVLDAAKVAIDKPAPGEKVQAALPLFVVHFTTGPAWDKKLLPNDQPGFKEHSQNLARLRGEGKLVMGARYQDREADKGMVVMRAADKAAVTAEFTADPMVKDKRFVMDVAEFSPFYDGFVARPARSTAAPSALDNLGWLAGCWFGRGGKAEFREHWMRPAGGLMLGMGRTLADGKLLSYEAMRIELDAGGTPVFVAKPSGQSEATFKAIVNESNLIVFENPAHDFPQRVRYELRNDGTLHARIEGKQQGKDARIEFPMRRATCE